jgi:biotin transport system substrate-specific component
MTAATFATHPRTVLADLLPGERARDAALVVAGAGLTGLLAQVAIHTPLTPVPFTLQTFAALLVGASLGPVRGLVSMAVYLLAGLVGVPWFADGSHGYSASFGYIVGFTLAAGVVGILARRGADRRVVTTVALMTAGTVVTYLFGASWLALDLHLSIGRAWSLGVQPFLVGDALKAAAAAVLLPAAWGAVRRVRG